MLTYRIDISQQPNYYQAILKYLSDIRLETIIRQDGTDDDVPDLSKKERSPLSALPQHVARYNLTTFTIKCSAWGSAEKALPAFDRSALQRSIGAVDFAELNAAKASAGVLDPFFKHETFHGPKGYMSPGHYDEAFKANHTNMSKKQAMLLLNEIASKYEVTSAILLPQQEAMFFQLDSKFYAIRFGANPGFEKSEEFAFDLDDGFVQGPRYVLIGLNSHFENWKEANYAGDMLTVSGMGLVELAPSRVAAPVVAAAVAPAPAARASAGGIFAAPQASSTQGAFIPEPWCAPNGKL